MQITSTDRRIARQGIGTTVKSGPPSALGFDFRPTAINAALNTRGQTGAVDADRMDSLRTRARTVVDAQQRKPSESRNTFNNRKEGINSTNNGQSIEVVPGASARVPPVGG